MILGLALLLGLAVTWGLGARISRLGELRLRGGGLVLASLAIQLTIFTRISGNANRSWRISRTPSRPPETIIW